MTANLRGGQKDNDKSVRKRERERKREIEREREIERKRKRPPKNLGHDTYSENL